MSSSRKKVTSSLDATGCSKPVSKLKDVTDSYESGDMSDYQESSDDNDKSDWHSSINKSDVSGSSPKTSSIYPSLSDFKDASKDSSSESPLRTYQPIYPSLNQNNQEPLTRRPLPKGTSKFPTQQAREVEVENQSSWMSWINQNWYVVIIILSIGFGICIWCGERQPVVERQDSAYQVFLNRFNDIKGSFQQQSTDFWRILRAGIKPIVEQDNPTRPAVFIIVVPSDADRTANCVIRRLSGAVTKHFKVSPPVEFTPKNVDILTPEVIKHQVDDTLSDGLSSGSAVAVIHHLERLPGESAMMLHSFCDNENAPYRRAVFFLTLHVDELSSVVTETDDFVENRLSTLWSKQLGSNRFPPLFSRIGNSIAFVRPETSSWHERNKC